MEWNCRNFYPFALGKLESSYAVIPLTKFPSDSSNNNHNTFNSNEKGYIAFERAKLHNTGKQPD